MRKSLKFTLALSLLFVIYQLSSCQSDNESNPDCKNVACTDELRTIVISIKDQDQNPVALDAFEVTNLANGSDLTISLSPSGLMHAQQLGVYPLVEDGGVEMHQELQLRFKGFINSLEVIHSDYVVTADCCHVQLISGNLELATLIQ